MIHIKTAYPKFRKRTKWLQDKHNSTFIQWLRFKVQSELEEDNNGVSENLRWLAAGPNMAVPLYRSYLIKGIKFNIKAQDDMRTTQNSGVYLLAQTMQVASAKDKNPILSNMGFYGVIQEIWDLDYQKFTIPVFRCDWIDSSGLVVDELGFTLVDLSKIGHRNDQFVLASQVKQIFFVDDPMHRGWSVVLSMPNREYNDVIGDEVLGDVIIECEPFTRGMPNVDTFDELVLEEMARKSDGTITCPRTVEPAHPISPTGSVRSSLSVEGKSKAELQEIARQLIMQASQMDDDEDNGSPSSSSCQPMQAQVKPKSWYEDSQDPYDAYDLHSD
ncbi:hypothetical protein L3X38_014097 [Prunus dulcis]|uniref:DUF4216 domain-containing protein n=1 Tax=Prunus dulcis TaxID=3755 RepID=A0AAD4WMH9_PRUDU|nr:hypothetical protein L3X38_014097 [Prunus dulcis]